MIKFPKPRIFVGPPPDPFVVERVVRGFSGAQRHTTPVPYAVADNVLPREMFAGIEGFVSATDSWTPSLAIRGPTYMQVLLQANDNELPPLVTSVAAVLGSLPVVTAAAHQVGLSASALEDTRIEVRLERQDARDSVGVGAPAPSNLVLRCDVLLRMRGVHSGEALVVGTHDSLEPAREVSVEFRPNRALIVSPCNGWTIGHRPLPTDVAPRHVLTVRLLKAPFF